MKIHESARRQGEPFIAKVSCRFLFARTKQQIIKKNYKGEKNYYVRN